ncbi:Diguanylate cyclase [Candidatus Hydrogenisulfobacillus filiaventi]|uniref:Diguanylate cyclase n=1 Tax=Candidatus Hydrogenisulfobacillus filiaventi TaxID=2707344 RepID=A0A6F8ZH37_9FIRM|nr:flavin reductase family protein [Bacillota bacterium]CAB1129197.1 Diguanylate cyclase [Candidatus Hydrogenisulfobacillus filiaventi]
MDEAAKKTMLRGITYGLYVVGVRKGEELNAFTANWLTQASFQPPLVVLAAKAGTLSQEYIDAEGVFAVSVLAAGQKDLAAQFFKPAHRVGNKLGSAEFRLAPETGCPVLTDTLGYFECRVRRTLAEGDHTVYLAEVVGAEVFRSGDPLAMRETGWNYGG